jgi:transcriptional regulator with XRE-family HTH domain
MDESAMQDEASKTGQASCARDFAARFGALVRDRREAMQLRQEDIAFATGFGRRFIIELEAGKASCQLGKALAVAAAVGLRALDLMGECPGSGRALLLDMPRSAEGLRRG